jgi:hypothetical protein
MSAETKVVISGDNSGAVKAIADTKKAFTEAAGQMAGALSPLTTGLGAFQGALAAVGAVLAGGAMFKASISAANDWNSQVGSIAKSMGISAEQASVMAVALDHLGLSSETVAAASMAMTRQLAKNEEAFTALGVQTRNLANGSLLPAGEIMTQVNTKLAAIKNGTEQNVVGLAIYGKAWNEVRGMVRLTADELAHAEQRARDLGLVIGSDAVGQTRQYKEQLRDLKLVGQALEIQIGEKLLPVFVKLGAWIAGDGSTTIKTFATALSGVGFALQLGALNFQKLGQSLGAFAAQAAAVLQGNFTLAKNIGLAWQEDDAAIEAAKKKLWDGVGQTTTAAESSTAKRRRLLEEFTAASGVLEHLRAQQAGKADADILEDDDKRTKAQIANAEKLRDALRGAWQAGLEEAKKARLEAEKLTTKAADTRASAADKIAEIKNAQKTPEEQAYANARDLRESTDSATTNSLLAKTAAYAGRTENAAKLADQASKDAERASKAADKLTDPGEKIKALERIAEASAGADEARAKIKQQEAAKLEETAASQASKLNEMDAQIEELKNKAANIELQVKIDQATAAIDTIISQLGAIQDKTVTVTVNTVTTGSAGALIGASTALPDGSGASDGGGGEFAAGGYTGPGEKFQPAGIVHAEEFVLRREVVRQPGALAILSRLNAEGLSALPGFAEGGMVGHINTHLLPSPPPAARSAAVFNFPDLGSYPVSMDVDIMGRLSDSFARAALQKGGRR